MHPGTIGLFPLFVLAMLLATPPEPGTAQKEPAKVKPIEPIHLENVNTEADEDDPFFVGEIARSYDGPMLYYASNAGSDGRSKSYHIMASRHDRQGKWKKGQPLESVQGKGEERSPFLLKEKKANHLYYASNRLGENFDLFHAMHKSKDLFLESATINNEEICTSADEMHPWLTAGGSLLYFSRKTKEGWRVYVSERPGGAGGFEAPHGVDLPPDFHHAALMPDGKTMYLQGLIKDEHWGLFKCSLEKDKKPWDKRAWINLKPLDRLNSNKGKKGDCSPSLAKQGNAHFLYFASDRPGGAGGLDLYFVNVKALDD